MSNKHVSILVSGRVQGVYYRASAKEMALQLGLAGFVRNEPDGSVYIQAEGESVAIMQFIAWCRKGPPRAIVHDVQVEESTPGNFTGFTIDRY
jgi:acylphosphatase